MLLNIYAQSRQKSIKNRTYNWIKQDFCQNLSIEIRDIKNALSSLFSSRMHVHTVFHLDMCCFTLNPFFSHKLIQHQNLKVVSDVDNYVFFGAVLHIYYNLFDYIFVFLRNWTCFWLSQWVGFYRSFLDLFSELRDIQYWKRTIKKPVLLYKEHF